MTRHVWLLISGAVWAFMMYLLFERELLPYLEYQAPPSYRHLLREKQVPEHKTFSVTLGTQTVGEAESLMRPIEGGGHIMETRMKMDMQPFMALKLLNSRMYVEDRIEVDSEYQLANFLLRANVSGIGVSVRGKREDDKLLTDYRFLRLRDQRVFEFPKDATIGGDFFPFPGGTDLEVGKKWKIKMIDVQEMLSLSKSNKLAMTELFAKVVGREVVQCLGGRDTLATKVEVRKELDPLDDKTPDFVIWVDKDGVVVRQIKMINRLPCVIVLESMRNLSDEEAAAHSWSVNRGR